MNKEGFWQCGICKLAITNTQMELLKASKCYRCGSEIIMSYHFRKNIGECIKNGRRIIAKNTIIE
jgi:ribosomal protein S27AE